MTIQPCQGSLLDHEVLREAGRQVAGTQPRAPPFDVGNANNDIQQDNLASPVTGLPPVRLMLVDTLCLSLRQLVIHKLMNLHREARRELFLLDLLFRKIN